MPQLTAQLGKHTARDTMGHLVLKLFFSTQQCATSHWMPLHEGSSQDGRLG